jgi:hypothetical protein
LTKIEAGSIVRQDEIFSSNCSICNAILNWKLENNTGSYVSKCCDRAYEAVCDRWAISIKKLPSPKSTEGALVFDKNKWVKERYKAENPSYDFAKLEPKPRKKWFQSKRPNKDSIKFSDL